MSKHENKSDRDLLIENVTNTEWIKEKIKSLDVRVSIVERKVWYGAGVMAVALIILKYTL